MRPVFKHSEYLQMFSTNSLSYLSADIIMDYYKTLDVLMTFSGNRWTSYIPNKVVEKTLKEGLEILGNKDIFRQFKNEIESYYQRVNLQLSELLSHNEISSEQCRTILDLLTENYKFYSKTEFFYIDEAYKQKERNPIIEENLKEFETVKNDSRSKLNAILYQPGSFRKMFLKKMSAQFSVPLEHISSCSKSEILKLYEGNKVSEKDIIERENSYLIYSKSGRVVYFQGDVSKKMISEFDSDEGKDIVIVKGIGISKGRAVAPVTIIKFGGNAFSKLSETISKMPQGNVLVADSTGPELILACKKASAILTNQGGMMSHAAIVSRELNIPCIVGLKAITEILKDGDMVEVDAEKGIVTLIK